MTSNTLYYPCWITAGKNRGKSYSELRENDARNYLDKRNEKLKDQDISQWIEKTITTVEIITVK